MGCDTPNRPRSTSPTDVITVEGFYLLDWTETKIDPLGSFYSATDLAGKGANKVMLGFGSVPDSIPVGTGLGGTAEGGPSVAVPRDPDQAAGNSGQYGAALRLFPSVLNEIELGLFFINYHSRLPIINARTGTPAGLFAGDYAASAAYFISYPEDIQLLGGSFNTEIGTTGIALQGEASYRWDAPLQVDDVELLFASISPLALVGSPLGTLLANTNQIGAFGFDEVVPGFIERNVTQIQSTVSKVFGPSLGADQAVLLSEVAVTRVHDMPDKDTLRLEAPGTFTSGNPIHTRPDLQPATEPGEFFADPTSWGYRVVGRLEYNRAIGAINLLPRFSWQHDVRGNSPGPGGNFIEGRKAFTAGLTGVYLNTWSVDISYSSFFGAGRHNLLNDRDFLAWSVAFAF